MHKPTMVRPLAIGLVVAGALARLAPHPWNFTPVGSVSLFAGARLRGWQAFLLPLVLMAITDPLLGGYSAATPFIYAAFVMTVWIGRRLQSTASPVRIGLACVASSVLFFVLSNFGTWLAWYPHTAAGLAQCYTLALPFFGRTLAGDLIYSGVLFGLHAWLSRTISKPERIAAHAA
jgi:uncharacterized protein DUF6580